MVASTSRARETFGAVALTCAVVFLAGTVIGGVDDWPFTSAPMYSTYVGPETPLYRFRLDVEKNGITSRERLKMRGLGIEAEEFTFLYKFYVPYTWRLPYRRGFADTPAAFEQRMTQYFRIQRKRNRSAADRITLSVERYEHSKLTATHVVGAYDSASDAFTLSAPGDERGAMHEGAP